MAVRLFTLFLRKNKISNELANSGYSLPRPRPCSQSQSLLTSIDDDSDSNRLACCSLSTDTTVHSYLLLSLISNWSHIAIHLVLVVGRHSSRKHRLRRFKLDQDEIWHDCCSLLLRVEAQTSISWRLLYLRLGEPEIVASIDRVAASKCIFPVPNLPLIQTPVAVAIFHGIGGNFMVTLNNASD